MKDVRTLRLAQAGLLAALYVALCVPLSEFYFGIIQFRISEMLTIIPVFSAVVGIPGLTVGCIATNFIGVATGTNPLGLLDVPIGSAATALAAYMTWRLRNVKTFGMPVAATIPPVVINALVVGTELYYAYGDDTWYGFVFSIGLTQFVMCTIGGLILYNLFEKLKLSRQLFGYTA